jgi:hypothetical protein
MIKDINGKEVTSQDKTLVDIEELYDRTSYTTRLEKNEIIGFAKFKPFLDYDNRFINQLIRGAWYPIENIKPERDMYIQLDCVAETHLGLFESVVAVEGQEHKFKHLTNENPRVVKYFNKKQKEKDEHDNYHVEMAARFAAEKIEKNEIKEKRGVFVKRNYKLSVYINASRKNPNIEHKEALFKTMTCPETLKAVLKDIDYRLKTVALLKDIPYEKSYYDFFNKGDRKHENNLNIIKEEILAFDFNNEKSFNIFKDEKPSITDFIKDKLSLLLPKNNSKKPKNK